jgi:hypothetical protein
MTSVKLSRVFSARSSSGLRNATNWFLACCSFMFTVSDCTSVAPAFLDLIEAMLPMKNTAALKPMP